MVTRAIKRTQCVFTGSQTTKAIMDSTVTFIDLPCSQCWPVHPVGHRQRYRLFVNPDWQVAPLRQWLLSQALCKKTQTNKQSTRKLTESFMFYSMFRIISKDMEVPIIVRSTYVTLVIYLIFGTPTPTSH